MKNDDFLKILSGLPADVQEAITSIDSAEKIQSIGKKHTLHIDQIGTLGDETGLVMFGITKPEEFQGNLTKRLMVPDDTAAKIVTDINEQIFSSIRESMKKIHSDQKAADSVVAPLEEKIDREILLKEIETPAPATVPSFTVSSVPVSASTPSPAGVSVPVTSAAPVNLPVGAPTLPIETPPPAPSGFAAVKLAGVAEAPVAKTVEKSESIAAIKKTDPYREPIA